MTILKGSRVPNFPQLIELSSEAVKNDIGSICCITTIKAHEHFNGIYHSYNTNPAVLYLFQRPFIFGYSNL
ncbi:unnamed protein product [Aspergillus oryzae]|uniref:Unnamed protein product n=2 Tax=Aspergillus oryzae TaxID=5062 RepID=A0AAN5BTJ3_ASPOZ|nr:unnamed protein product [Aspergillus oryzae]GMF90446.1 unnamed protein product [Aspergillus oryzae]GMG07527.1 unnamed protein product [Aspergillus oryzae]GMG25869.1 unnamed protein product [Aspergillus oryzae]GMG51031.1 unnamed protein product [Aspergillus oryzae var. brunneus]